ncbi:hypothetical protein [Leifsonia shinshuensis]|uniref:Uncharacterized protein n=1 Tax=Leifsonia shinshuensis TaxID=150026 RepID=A0A7G6YA49_9MICO|nr:hypothetical protein [Leifsonia shinshuensis]QNE35364.1 hypothetical protein F1C12_09640 [Leifsonia shinshuensis]
MTGQISRTSRVYRWPHLNVLPECELAAEALQAMGVEALCFPGWAPAVLALAVEQLSIRPGAALRFESRGGALRLRTFGGTHLPKHGPDYVTRVNASSLANSFCELCGRPGRPLQVHTLMSLCDVDWHLYRSYRTVRGVPLSEMTFPPRLPIAGSATAALVTIAVEFGKNVEGVPEGWADPALTALVDFAGIGVVAGDLTFESAESHLVAALSSPTDESRWRAIAKSLGARTAATCRDCGRRIPAGSDRVGRCGGCDALQRRGWHIVFPDSTPTNEKTRKETMDVPAFLAALPIGSVFTHANPREQPDSWVRVDELYYRRTYGWTKFTAADFADWGHAELTTPVDYSISQAEADRREADARRRPHTGEMGG